MVYTNTHQYLTVHWEVASAQLEHGQFGLRFDRLAPPNGTELQDAADTIAAFWNTSGVAIPDYFRLTHIKVATIGTSGLYPDDSEAVIHDYPSPIAGGGTNVRQFPLQVSHVMSLMTSASRGRAHRGRVYLPALAQNLDNSDKWPANVVLPRVDGFNIMIANLQVDLNSQLVIMSKLFTGTTRQVTRAIGGTRPDVQRRRARQLDELYVEPTP